MKKLVTEATLRREMEYHLSLCQNEFERINCKALCEKEIRERFKK
jgi:hypothetical protein